MALLVALLAGLADVGVARAQIDDVAEESVARRPRLDFESYGLSLDPVDRGGRSSGSSAAARSTPPTSTSSASSSIAATPPASGPRCSGFSRRSSL